MKITIELTPEQLYLAASALDRIDLALTQRSLAGDEDPRATWEALMVLLREIAAKMQ
ncbi:MAG: hypothetical protein AAGG51_30530 [Cyanobacteria bacterium P01_G01_bin.54]